MQFAFDLSQRCGTSLTGDPGQGFPPLPGSSQPAQPAWPEKKMGTFIIIQEKFHREKFIEGKDAKFRLLDPPAQTQLRSAPDRTAL